MGNTVSTDLFSQTKQTWLDIYRTLTNPFSTLEERTDLKNLQREITDNPIYYGLENIDTEEKAENIVKLAEENVAYDELVEKREQNFLEEKIETTEEQKKEDLDFNVSCNSQIFDNEGVLDDEEIYNAACAFTKEDDLRTHSLLSKIYIRNMMDSSKNTLKKYINEQLKQVGLSLSEGDYETILSYYKKSKILIKIKCDSPFSRRSSRIKHDTIEEFIYKKFVRKNVLNSNFSRKITTDGEYYVYQYISISDIEKWHRYLIERYQNANTDETLENNITIEDTINMFYIGLKSTKIDKDIIIKLVDPTRKQRVGAGSVPFEKLYSCKTQDSEKNCEFSFLLDSVLSDIDVLSSQTNFSRKDVLKAFILWCDSHHDFKKVRIIEPAKGREYLMKFWNSINENYEYNFIGWYSDQFFSIDGIAVKPADKDRKVDELLNVTFFYKNLENTVLHVFYEIHSTHGRTKNMKSLLDKISNSMYRVSVKFLRDKEGFEKTFLMIYLIKYYFIQKDKTDGQEVLSDAIFMNLEPDDEDREKIENRFKIKKFNDKAPEIFKNATRSDYIEDCVTTGYDVDKAGLSRKYVYAALFDANRSNTPKNISLYTPPIKPSEEKTIIDVKVGDKTFIYTKQKNSECDVRILKRPETDEQINNFKARVKCQLDNKCDSKYEIIHQQNKDIAIIKIVKDFISKNKNKNYIKDDGPLLIEFFKKIFHNFSDTPSVEDIKGVKINYPNEFNDVKKGPSVGDLFGLILFYKMKEYVTGVKVELEGIDLILSLKRIGDYGQVLDAKNNNIAMLTADSMETVMCLTEKTSCIIDFRPGVFYYIGENLQPSSSVKSGDFIISKSNKHYKYNSPVIENITSPVPKKKGKRSRE